LQDPGQRQAAGAAADDGDSVVFQRVHGGSPVLVRAAVIAAPLENHNGYKSAITQLVVSLNLVG
jgi:hypothetical protein